MNYDIYQIPNSLLFERFVSFKFMNKSEMKSQKLQLHTYSHNVEPHFTMPMEETSVCIFNHLKTIKINSFKGHKNDMRLAKFLLQKATELESLVLVAPKNNIDEDVEKHSALQATSSEKPSQRLHKRLSLRPKASIAVQIILHEYWEDDDTLRPTHTEFHDWKNH